MAKTKKLTTPEGQALIEAFVQSGLKAKKFCAHNKIHYHVLQYWRRRFEHQSAGAHKKQAKFFPVTIINTEAKPTQHVLTIKIGAKLSVEAPAGCEPSHLKQVLEICLSCG